MTSIRQVLALTAVFTLAMALVAGPAAAQEYPPGEDGLAVSVTVVTPGGTITVSAPPDSFEPGSVVQVTVGPLGGQSAGGGPPLASAASSLLAQGNSGEPFTLNKQITAAEDGSATTTIEIPEDARPGRYRLTMSGPAPDEGTRTLSTEFTITAEEAAGGQAQGLAFTGANAALWGGLAAGLLVLGGGALFVAKRRSRTEAGTKAG